MSGRERRRGVFTTVHSEGALLPPDFLQRLLEGAKGIDGLSPESYHLVAGEKPSEAASRSWNRLQAAWAAFQTASQGLRPEDAGTGLTREKWLLPIFQELGYGRLQPAKDTEIDGKAYPISHVWQQAPIHLLGRNVELDRRSPGVIGAAKTTPHGLLQEFLNRHEGHLWGFVSNGLKLRILRDNKSLTRQAYVEFDLAGMMDGQVYSDFALLWLLCHQSRVEAEKAEQCWLEKWTETVRREGVPALDRLRKSVEAAIEALGKGFLAHPANKALIETLRAGTLDKQDYYRQLLRVVYRLIFLFVAEDRDLLLTAPPGAKERSRYLEHYSVSRLRTLAERRRGTPHPDLWQSLKLVFGKLSDTGCKELGLPALGSFLWSDKATPALDRAELANADLLDAVRSLAFTKDGTIRRAIDYRNLGAEELGSVYESLLELHPDLNADAPTFALKVAAGHERKTTGSYYTPTSLIECLLDSALDPVLDEAAKKPDPEKAILDLKVCDPACGSGHFLIAAAHRMANRLAKVRTGDEEPSPEAVRKALRDIVGRCLYGVDINPMAVELCKVNLWLEALEPGKPLSFLEHHIQCGNSLLGATPALLKKGIPDEAFEPLEGDDKKVCTILRKQNKSEREGQQGSLLDALHGLPERESEDLGMRVAAIDAIPDESIEGQKRRADAWSKVVSSAPFDHAKLVADAWCAAFVWKKKDDPVLQYGITERVFRRLQDDPSSVPTWMRSETARLAQEYRFFHWQVAFPSVLAPAAVNGTAGRSEPGLATRDASVNDPGWMGGFDIVLGNPPWERLKLQEKEFFAERRPDIAEAPNAAARSGRIRALEAEDPALLAAFRAALRRADGESALVRSTGRYPLCGVGDVNTYSVFAELNRDLLATRGRAGFIVPTGIATDDTTKRFVQQLVEGRELVQLIGFENEDRLFPGVHHAFKFCILTLATTGSGPRAPGYAFYLRHPSEMTSPERAFALDQADIAQLNPNTRTCPIFRSSRDADITKAIYRRVPVLIDETKRAEGNPWGIQFQAMFHMSNDSGLFRTRKQLEADGWSLSGNVFRRGDERYVPLYEAKMVHHFDHRFGTYEGQSQAQANQGKLPELDAVAHANTEKVPLPRYWVPEPEVEHRLRGHWDRGWLLGWRRSSRSTDERTFISAVLPRVGVGDSVFLLLPGAVARDAACLAANLSSFAFDYIARQKSGGTNNSFFIVEQLPALPPDTYRQPAPWEPNLAVGGWMAPRVLELMYTAADLEPLARDLGYYGPPFRWDPDRRLQVRSELDAAFFHLYGIARDDLDYIMDTFPIVRDSDQERHGRYRTKERILEEYDRQARAAAQQGTALETADQGEYADRQGGTC